MHLGNCIVPTGKRVQQRMSYEELTDSDDDNDRAFLKRRKMMERSVSTVEESMRARVPHFRGEVSTAERGDVRIYYAVFTSASDFVADDTPLVGFRWLDTGRVDRPDNFRYDLTSKIPPGVVVDRFEGLLEFTRKQWASFGIDSVSRRDCLKWGDTYFVPSDTRSCRFIERSVSPISDSVRGTQYVHVFRACCSLVPFLDW
jgi:hypothetical protein